MSGPAAPPRPTNLAHGRWLGDFPRLTAAEKALVAYCARGEEWKPRNWDETRPDAPTPANTIRADLIRFLALGGDPAHPIHEHGVMLGGAWIADELDVHQCRLSARLDFRSCRFAASPSFLAASLPELSLRGCLVPGLTGDRLRVAGGLFLDDAFSATGEVRLLGAEIGGSLECGKGSFANPEGNALAADGAVVKGGVFLNAGFSATGAVRLPGAQIGGDLNCSKGSFANAKGGSLSADGATIKGGLFLREAQCAGSLSLAALRIGSLVDDRECWTGGRHVLDGLGYDRIIGPTDAARRIAWLRSQRREDLGAGFCPQPWEQLAKVLREMGHPHEARRIAIEKQRAMRRAGIRGLPPAKKPFGGWRNGKANLRALAERLGLAVQHPFKLLDEVLHRLFGVLSGYGHRPWNILGWVVVLWLGFAAMYWGFGVGCARLTGCTASPTDAALYSLDALLPVDFGIVKASLPEASISIPASTFGPVRAFSAMETLIGWILSGLVLAIVGNLVRKD